MRWGWSVLCWVWGAAVVSGFAGCSGIGARGVVIGLPWYYLLGKGKARQHTQQRHEDQRFLPVAIGINHRLAVPLSSCLPLGKALCPDRRQPLIPHTPAIRAVLGGYAIKLARLQPPVRLCAAPHLARPACVPKLARCRLVSAQPR